jgi:hypothetical protein
MREKRNAYGVVVRKLEGKRPLGKPVHGGADNIKIYPKEMGWD